MSARKWYIERHPLIRFFDADGNAIGEAKRSTCKRFSMQAAADHRVMDAFKARHPAVESAVIPMTSGDLLFTFKNGRSYHHGFA